MSLPHFILGALADQPMTGYDLNKSFQTSINHFWSTDQSQIYRALQGLKKRGFVTDKQIIQQDYPNKKLYSISPTGKQELRRWLQTPLGDNESPVREGWLGQLFFANHVEPAQTIEVLQAYLREEEQVVTQLTALHKAFVQQHPERSTGRIDRLRVATLEFGISTRRAGVRWLRHLITELESRETTQSV